MLGKKKGTDKQQEDLKKAADKWNKKSQAQKKADRKWGQGKKK